jgi:hypothetical protein
MQEGSRNHRKQPVEENVFFTTSKNKDWVHVDAKPCNVILSDTRLISVAWVDACGKERKNGEVTY